MVLYLEDGQLPEDQKATRKLAAMGLSFTLQDGVLYFVDSKHENRK